MLELAKVIAVNPRAKTVDLQCVNSHRAPTGVLLSYTSAHPDHAGGDDYMPEVGAYCYVAFPSDVSPPFVLCYVNKPDYGVDNVDELNYASNKAATDPGDRRLSTADGNKLVLRRGGLVELSSTALSKIMLVPVENLIRLYAQRFQLRSPLGEIDWGHTTLTADGAIQQDAVKKTPVLVKYGIKSEAQEVVSEAYTVEVRVGAVDERTLPSGSVHKFAHLFAQQDVQEHSPPTGNGTVSIAVFDHNSSRKAVFVFQINAAGDVYWHTDASIYIEAAKLFITADEVRAIVADIVLVEAPDIALGGDAGTQPAVLGTALIKWLNLHTHTTSTGPTTPPVVPAGNALLSGIVRLK